MAEFIMKYLTNEEYCSDKFMISSAATSNEEIGNDMYPAAKNELRKHSIPFEPRQARRITKNESSEWDVIIVMDSENFREVTRIMEFSKQEADSKVKLLMSFTGINRVIDDPWYTRNFAKAYDDIYKGCQEVLNYYRKKNFQA